MYSHLSPKEILPNRDGCMQQHDVELSILMRNTQQHDDIPPLPFVFSASITTFLMQLILLQHTS